MLLSICLTVFNQIDLVKNNLIKLLEYHGNDIEIVISDDCSTDSIKEMVFSFKDDRIQYTRTEANKSHDWNILHGLGACNGDYILLLRSKDYIIPDRIPCILDVIMKHPSASYFLFSCLDEEGNLRMQLEDKIYRKGKDAVEAHGSLLIHPSGQIYRRDMLRLELYKDYIALHFPEHNGCNVHQLIRMDLAIRGDFITSSCVTWIYSYTFKSRESSVIKTKDKLNIYAPMFSYQRLQCEFDFIDREIESQDDRMIFLKQIFSRYAWLIVPQFAWINQNKYYNSHYNSQEIPFSQMKEFICFTRITRNMINNSINVYNMGGYGAFIQKFLENCYFSRYLRQG